MSCISARARLLSMTGHIARTHLPQPGDAPPRPRRRRAEDALCSDLCHVATAFNFCLAALHPTNYLESAGPGFLMSGFPLGHIAIQYQL
jgi:hypothetical protein